MVDHPQEIRCSHVLSNTSLYMGTIQDYGHHDHPLNPTNHECPCRLHYIATLAAPLGEQLPPHVHMCFSPTSRREVMDQCQSSGMKPLKK